MSRSLLHTEESKRGLSPLSCTTPLALLLIRFTTKPNILQSNTTTSPGRKFLHLVLITIKSFGKSIGLILFPVTLNTLSIF